MKVMMHGVGSNHNGMTYHHYTAHLAPGVFTLCGTNSYGSNWYHSWDMSPEIFEHPDAVKKGDTVICKRCAAAYKAWCKSMVGKSEE